MIRTGDAARLPGTRIQNRCPVTSIGLDAIDTLMGGGIPLSNIYVISESNSKRYAPLLQRYFVAEGLLNQHAIFVDGPSLDVNELLENLPSSSAIVQEAANASSYPTGAKDEMQIAWRYKTMPMMNSALSSKDKTRFDLTKRMDVNKDHVSTIHATSYAQLWTHLFGLIRSEDFLSGKGRRILRILLTDIGSPLFDDPQNCRRFLRNLKSLIQQANVVVMLTVDEAILNEDQLLDVRSVADAYFRLDVPDTETKNDFGLEERYDGRFHIVKLPQLNAFTTNKPDYVDLVFEKHRRYFEIRILHLPAVMGGADTAKTPCQRIQEQF